MKRYAVNLRTALSAALLGTIAACAGLQPSGPDVTTDFEPPAAWRSGVKFTLSDRVLHDDPGVNYSTRVEFTRGGRLWVVTNRDLFQAIGEVRTPWYRLSPQADPITLRVTVEHPGGVQTQAEYPLFVKRDEFYSVGAHVYTRPPAPSHAPYLDINPVAYPLHPAAQARPGDSLWISFTVTPRNCFNCPT